MATLGLEEKLVCVICLELYQEAVTLLCGHNFCRKCIEDYWDRGEIDCPHCRTLFKLRPALHKNGALCEVVESLRAAEGQPAATEPALGPCPAARCPRHGRALELYCRTEKRCICCVCTVGQCEGHLRVLADVERKEQEKWLKEQLEENQNQKIKIDEQLKELQDETDRIQNSANTQAVAISEKVTCLLRTLEARRDKALQNIEREKMAVLAQAKETKQCLQDHLELLAQNTQQIQELLTCPNDVGFLQRSPLLTLPGSLASAPSLKWDEDVHQLNELKKMLDQIYQLLLRNETGPGMPRDVDPGFKEPTPGPVCRLRKELRQNYRNLTFDPDTANHHFHLSRQNQRVKHDSGSQLDTQPGRFQLWQVLCAQSFEAGKHYWEVEVSDHSVTLGVTYPELARKNVPGQTDNIGRNRHSWGLRVQEEGCQAWHDGKVQRLLGTPGHLLGVELDLSVGRLSFYSLEPRVQLLHVFDAFFTQPLSPVFWLCEGRTITLCQVAGAKPCSGPQGETLGPRRTVANEAGAGGGGSPDK
ncbi:E3 ubiquitin-protein ligase TRIM65 [Monodelphis domestica]|uniref:E3 ubiquitin-protein ligase TRIM65 n=1 Tax=Monodelphis domestica TaxID=13616 RepID=UPI0024E1DCFC|nr:E3 ubiquitin-protein ligase TRIM65 [Monodelphis domestica]